MSSVPKTPATDPPAPDPPEAAPAPAPAAAPEPGPKSRKKKRILLSVVAVAVAAGVLFGVKTILFYAHHVETDDAQVEGHIAPVLPKVSGYVTEVLVTDNQRVAAGQVVLRIDERDLRSKVATAQADRDNTRAAVSVARSSVVSARAQRERTASDLKRYATLRQKEEVSSQQFDGARAAAEAAAASLEGSAQSVSAAIAKVAQKQADLDFAKLQLSYSTVTAPATGIVSRKSVEVGQNVQAGQPLLAIVSDEQPWVVANFKETQLKKMRIGQSVAIDVDAYPKHDFHGRVESIAAATGAKFALLPPDNATGNFTKVVQRVPVKIVFTDPTDPVRPLRAGMSVNAIVAVD
ncbi:MAG: HlyD family secretion protein [Acidobacteriota bacterium]